jgi:GTPase
MKAGFVALLGRPNAGKSTLLNALVGAKVAIVSEKPQTTRARILGVKSTPDAQLVFVDTPGIHRPLHRMNVRMVDAAVDTIGTVDVIALVVDASEKTGAGTQFVLDLLRDVSAPVVLVLTKIDLVAKPALLPLMRWFSKQREFADIAPVSAQQDDGLDRLERALVARLPEGEPIFPDDYLTDQPERQIAAEFVREQVLAATHDELPFSSAVTVDSFEEAESEQDKRGLLRIYATILVEQPSQKPIVIGRHGEMIKRIGTAARLELERFFGARVFLDLYVKVSPEWRQNERVLDSLGVPSARRRGGGGRKGSRSRSRSKG